MSSIRLSSSLLRFRLYAASTRKLRCPRSAVQNTVVGAYFSMAMTKQAIPTFGKTGGCNAHVLTTGQDSSERGASYVRQSTSQSRGVTTQDGVSAWGGLLEVDIPCAGSGDYPLHEAAASGSVGAVLSLLDLGANVSAVNACGDTPLHVCMVPACDVRSIWQRFWVVAE